MRHDLAHKIAISDVSTERRIFGESRMIWESGPWKDRLLSDADLLERWAAKQSVTERRSYLLEQKIFISAYAIRKLFESEKVSSSFFDRSEHCVKFDSSSDQISGQTLADPDPVL